MRYIVLCIMFVATVIGSSSVLAQNTSQYDTKLLLTITRDALTQVKSQLPADTDDEIKELVEMGRAEVDQLKTAIDTDDIESIKLHFINAMGIFKQISIETTTLDEEMQFTASNSKLEPDIQLQTPESPTTSESEYYTDHTVNMFYRLQNQVTSLKIMSNYHNIQLNFTTIDTLIAQGTQAIERNDIESLGGIVQSIDESIQEIKTHLDEQAIGQEFERARAFADVYLKEIDSILLDLKGRQISDAMITEIKIIKERIKSANTTDEIVLEIKKIILVSEHLDKSKKHRLEARVTHLEQTISRLNQNNDTSLEQLTNMRVILDKIKHHIQNNEYNTARYMTNYLDEQIQNIRADTLSKYHRYR